MKVSEILKEERQQNRNKNVARLYLEGDWYRGYEWSAYLAHNYPNSLTEEKKLKPIHRFVKECNEGVISVGLKLSMMDKYMPNAKYEIKDGCVEVEINNLEDGTEANSDALLSKWKKEVPLKEAKPKVGKTYSQPLTMTQIMKEVMAYRMENTTAEEDREFLYALKDKCYSLI